MTTQARVVLDDCKGALTELVDGVQGSEWRRRWVTVVALLRAVGHVLEKVDSKTSPEMAAVIKDEFERLKKSKPEPKIFWSFIDKERNNIVKEYKFGAGQGVTVRPGTIFVDLRTGEQSASPSAPTKYSYPITTGPFTGRDQREIITEAIEWWENYLDRIDRACSKKI